MMQRWWSNQKVDAITESQVTAWMALVLGDHESDFLASCTRKKVAYSKSAVPRSFLGLIDLLADEQQPPVLACVTAAVTTISSKELGEAPYVGEYQDLLGVPRARAMRTQVRAIVRETLSSSASSIYTKLIRTSPANTPADATGLTDSMVLSATNLCQMSIAPQVLLALDKYCSAVIGTNAASTIDTAFFENLKRKIVSCAEALAKKH